MSKKKIWIALTVVLALNVTLVLVRMRNSQKWTALWEDVRAKEAQEISRGYRAAPLYSAHQYFGLIGALVKNDFWTKVLPLDEEQANAITKLDNLVWKARIDSWHADADYLDGSPADYQDYVARNDSRRQEVIRHAQRMVSLGLLTKPQAAFVTQRFLSRERQSYSLGDENMQELLGMTKNQETKLAELWEASSSHQARLNLMSVDPEEQKKNMAEMTANDQATDAAAMKILTPSQRDTWSQLTAKRTLPAEPPELPALSDTEAARIKLEDLSPTFRALAEKTDALGLSAEQKKLLKDLEEVTREGLWWISLRTPEESIPPADARKEPADRVAQTRAEFLKQAEQVALLGILTERQAEQVQDAIKRVVLKPAGDRIDQRWIASLIDGSLLDEYCSKRA